MTTEQTVSVSNTPKSRHRILVDLKETTYKEALRVVAEQNNISMAALMRNAINKTYPDVPKLWREYRKLNKSKK